MKVSDKNGLNYDLKDIFFKADLLKKKGVLDEILRGIVNQPAQAVDNSIASDVS